MIETQIQQQILNCCAQNEVKDVMLYFSKQKTTVIQVADEQLESFQMSEKEGIHISGSYHGFQGETYLEQYENKSIEAAVQNLVQTSQGNQKRAKKQIGFTVQKSQKTNNENKNDVLDSKKMIDEFILQQKRLKQENPLVVQVSGTGFRLVQEEIEITSEQGDTKRAENQFCQGSVSVVAAKNERKQNSHVSSFANEIEELDYLCMGKKAARDAIALLEAEPIMSGSYQAVLANELSAELLSSFLSIFYQESVEQGNSRFKNKYGEKVADNCLTIWQEPDWDRAPIKRSFDDEGTAANRCMVIEKGQLKWLPGSGTGQSTISTGNGKRADYRDVIRTGFWNLIVQKGSRDTKELIGDVDQGVFLTQTDGLFAGVNAKTGDFSAICQGFYIEHGKCTRGIKQITVGGNIYDLLSDLQEVSSDTAGSSNEWDYVESPAMKVKSLTIGGL